MISLKFSLSGLFIIKYMHLLFIGVPASYPVVLEYFRMLLMMSR